MASTGVTPEIGRLTPSQSDSLVEEIFKRREILESGNSRREKDGNQLRKSTWAAAFDDRYPTVIKTNDQLYQHYANRKKTLRKNMAVIKRYQSQTGGGIDEEMEKVMEHRFSFGFLPAVKQLRE
ncbi:hypothetical protein PMAYCL1PPCAC_00329 [Pristionchus mayeri]|uniref:Regulatory protein zeste n=1 Tax=Pristionchus mayeri TaxID=1317129 RepID=A0AAN4Z0A6_9BILA|nr:hypothetical protein PMAYCL1PPCAC_00326 [Pristionchus mayeri]GMR30134.1 hypothetical protein PMAYCL1PPCAC_00329 [Pristionchus mayeri]